MLSALLLAAVSLADLSGTVYLDRNANGRRDTGEPGLSGVVVSDQVDVVVTDRDGAFRIADSHGYGLVFVSVPDGYRSVGSFWRPTADGPAAFGLTRAPAPAEFTFVHASDTHISPASRARTERFRAMVDSIRPDFAIVTGDLVKDALRVGEAEATGYYQLFQEEASRFTVPLWTVPGNHENFGIEHAFMNSVHAYTNDQRLADVPGKDLRRSRAAAENIVPTSTYSPTGIGKILPELEGRLTGMALAVPVPDGSNVDLTVHMSRDVTREEVNAVVRNAAATTFTTIVEYSEDPLVSSDVIGNSHSAIFDGLSTMVMGGDLVKCLVWYDNGWGYSTRVVELILRLQQMTNAAA